MSTPHACWKKRKRTTNSSLHSSIACLVSSHESAISFVHVYCTKLRRRARPSRSCRGRSIRTQHERDTTPRPVFFFWQAGAVGAGRRELVPAKPHSPRSIAPRPPRPEQANAGSRTHSAHGPIAKGSPPLPTTKALSPPPKPNHAHKPSKRPTSMAPHAKLGTQPSSPKRPPPLPGARLQPPPFPGSSSPTPRSLRPTKR